MRLRSRSRPTSPPFAALMNAKAATLGLRDTHFVRPDGLDAPGHVSSARRRDEARAGPRCGRAFVRETVAEQTAAIAGGRTLHTWDDLLSLFPRDDRRQDGPHESSAGWCQVAAARGRGVTVYATLLGSPTRAERNGDLESLLIWGLAQFRVVAAVQAGRTYATAAAPYGERRSSSSPPRPLQAVARLGRPLTETVVAATLGARSRSPGRRARARRGLRAADACSGRATWSLPARLTSPASAGRLGWYAGRTLHHLGSLFMHDRHRHPQRGDRPDADRAELPARAAPPRQRRAHARRRQGHQRRARAEDARRAGRRDRSRRRHDRHAHRRGADERGDPQRLRPHRGRVAHLDGRRRPDRRHLHRDQRVGAGGRARSSRCCSRSCAI